MLFQLGYQQLLMVCVYLKLHCVNRWPFPDDSVRWNNWGGITTLLEDGDLLLGGFFSVKRYNIGHLR